MESVFVRGCNCFAGFQNSTSTKPDKKEKKRSFMLKSKRMLDKVAHSFTPSTPEACEFKDSMVYIAVPAQPALHRDILSPKRPNKSSSLLLFILFYLMLWNLQLVNSLSFYALIIGSDTTWF